VGVDGLTGQRVPKHYRTLSSHGRPSDPKNSSFGD